MDVGIAEFLISTIVTFDITIKRGALLTEKEKLAFPN